MTVVLAYKGVPSQRQEAEVKLRRALPGVVLTPKTTTIFEAQVEPAQVEEVVRSGFWRIVTPVYAEIRKPAYDFERLRAKLNARK